jgi:aconitate hydratase
MVPGVEGGVTKLYPAGEVMPIYDAAMAYQQAGVPLVVFGGKEYGTGSSRDWAAKGTNLLGVRAVITESFERIHRSNLVGMGVVPFQFADGVTWQSLGLIGDETVTIDGIETIQPRQRMDITITRANGAVVKAPVICRIDTETELDYFRNGGVLHYVLRGLAKAA